MPPARGKAPKADIKAFPHNGEGRPENWFPDPVNGEPIGGQVAAFRQAMRYPHVVMPWARRQGKSRMYQFLHLNMAAITSGKYWGGMVYPDHTSAAKVAEGFRESWGGLVADSKINDKDQDRWIRLHPILLPPGPPPSWFTPALAERWKRCQGKEPNEGATVYFWGGEMPHARKIQGFVHPFNLIGFDEAQEIESAVYPIVRPMLRDVRGHEVFSGTPIKAARGNAQFKRWWTIALANADKGWFCMKVPDGANPHVPRVDRDTLMSMSDEEIRQTCYAEFLSDAGAVFSNLDTVFCLTPLSGTDPDCAWAAELRKRYSVPTMRWWIVDPAPRDGRIYAASVDWARSPKGDYSVLTVFDMTTGRQVALFRWRGEDFTAQMEVVLAVQKHYGASQLHTDMNGMGEAMADFLRRRHALGFVGHRFGRNKPDYVRRGQVLFVDGSVSMINCEEQRREFEEFGAFEPEGIGSEKQVKYCAPEGGHDDTVAAFLHLAPTLTIVGRQEPPLPDPVEQPMFEEDRKTTTLERFVEGMPLPWSREEADGLTWADVVLPPKYR